MTLMVGIFSRRNRPLPDSACPRLVQSISRDPTDVVKGYRRNLRLAAWIHSRG